jgi:hypothetical protein
MSARTVVAPRTFASISGDWSTPTTACPSSTSRCVMRPAPQPSSKISAPGGLAACTTSGSPAGGASAYSSTGLPSGARCVGKLTAARIESKPAGHGTMWRARGGPPTTWASHARPGRIRFDEAQRDHGGTNAAHDS